MLHLAEVTLGDVVRPGSVPTSVAADATAADVQDASHRTGHLRIRMRSNGFGTASGVVSAIVHVRDTLDLEPGTPVAPVSRAVHLEPSDAPVYAVLARMRATSTHLVVVRDDDVDRGVVTMTDILARMVRPVTTLPGPREPVAP